MDFEYSPVQHAFYREFRDWLTANLPADLCLDDPADDRVASDRETFERRRAWQKTMHAAGWVGITWPKEYGGRGAGLIERVIWEEEYTAARAPVLPGNMGLSLVGPTLIHWGTEEQKRRHLPAILNADEIWCQGFSEPGAGSDLASLRTRAVDQGDHFVVNGQKVWTSGAHFADWCFLLVRTDPDAPKHHGISYLLVDMKTPGVTVRPLVLLNGHRHFNEVFFEDVVVPKENLVGPLNEGWKVTTTTLMFERGGAGGRDHAAQIARLLELAKQFPNRQEPAFRESHIRQQLAQLAIDAKALQVTRLRGLTRRLRGEPPGPEGSILKLFGSELATRIADFSSTLLGPYATLETPTEPVPHAPRWSHRVRGAGPRHRSVTAAVAGAEGRDLAGIPHASRPSVSGTIAEPGAAIRFCRQFRPGRSPRSASGEREAPRRRACDDESRRRRQSD